MTERGKESRRKFMGHRVNPTIGHTPHDSRSKTIEHHQAQGYRVLCIACQYVRFGTDHFSQRWMKRIVPKALEVFPGHVLH